MRPDYFAFFALLQLLSVSLFSQPIDLNKDWKFHTGDDKSWASPEFNDRSWESISPKINWEMQGHERYDGFAWYRLKFKLKGAIRDNAYLKDSLRILLSKIDDVDETYLNGIKIGKTGSFPEDKEGYVTSWDERRRYVIPANDPAIHWNAENVLAIRVYDGGGAGGLFEGPCNIDMVDLIDFVSLESNLSPFNFNGDGTLEKWLMLTNDYPLEINGGILVEVKNNRDRVLNKQVLISSLAGNSKKQINVVIPEIQNAKVTFSFKEALSGKIISSTLFTPYMLTPKPSDTPRINTPGIYAQRYGRPLLYRIPVTGKRPMRFQAEGLPPGTELNEETGILTGVVGKAGTYKVTLTAQNELGSDQKVWLLKIGEDICFTPPMGWNSWNVWGLSVNDQKVRQTANQFISTGLADHGWTYINIDDGWENDKRNADGTISPNSKFPDMKSLGDYVHSKGLKMGIYSSPGPRTCGGFLGSYQHEYQDAQTYAGWGIDYLKYDWCSYGEIAPAKPSLEEYKKPYRVMQDALKKVNRDIVYSLCQYGMGDVWTWGQEVGGNCWRTTGDITDTWESLYGIGFSQDICSLFAHPGHWNDPDMLTIGWVGWGPQLRQTRLTPSEQYTHISLWCLLSAPLLLGCDLDKLDAFTMNLITNDEVIAVDQDMLGQQARCMIRDPDYQIWLKDLEDGSRAIGIFNLSSDSKKIKVNWTQLGFYTVSEIRDLWRQKNLPVNKNHYEYGVFPHGVLFLKVKP